MHYRYRSRFTFQKYSSDYSFKQGKHPISIRKNHDNFHGNTPLPIIYFAIANGGVSF